MSDERDDVSTGSEDADDARSTEPTADGATPAADAGTGSTDGSDGATAPRPAGKRRPRRSAEEDTGSAGAVRPTGRRRPTATTEGKGRATRARAVAEAPTRRSPVTRVARFLREVVAELRKVIWPTRPQLVTYTTVVLVFVAFMVALVAGLDLAFAKGVLLIFG